MTHLQRISLRSALLVGIGLSISYLSAFALPSYTGGLARYNFTGLTLGLNIGGKTVSMSPSATSTTNGYTYTFGKDSFQLNGRINLGYGYAMSNRFYFGGEGGVDISTQPRLRFTEINAASNTRLSARNRGISDTLSMIFSADAMLGYLFADNFLLYGRLGLGYTSYRVAITEASGTARNPHPESNGRSLLRAGIGLRYAPSQNMNISLSFTHSSVTRFSEKFNTPATVSSLNSTLSIRPAYNTFLVGIEFLCTPISC